MPDESPNQDSLQSPEPDTSISQIPLPEKPSVDTHSSVDYPESPDSSKNNKSKIGWIIIAAAIVILVVAGITHYVKRHNSQAATVKKDIPYLTYGFTGSGDIPEIYPTETGDTNNTIFDDSQLFEGLVGYQNEIEIVPMLATGWYNPNDTTWIFNLRHGVKFHSGRTMNATDVAYSLNYAIAHQSDSGGDTALAFAGAIKQVKIINSYKVEIITNGPDAVLLNQLADLYIIDSKAKPGDPNAGTGPYTVEGDSIKPNATSVNLVASNDYWGGHVYTREVHIQEDATPDQLASDVANGKLDLSGDFDEQQLATVKAKIKNYQLIKVPDLGVSYIELNTEKTTSPLYSLAARQAIGYALNIPTILKAGAILGTQASQLIPSAIPGHDPSIMNTQYNPSKAKQLLSGVPNLSTPISLFYPSGDGGQVAEIAKELDAVGFNVKVSEIGDLGTLVNMEFAGQGDMFYLAYVSSTLDGLDIINNTVAGTQNFSSAELTSLINQTDVAFNPATRNADLYKIEHLVASDIPAVPLYTETRTYILTKPYTIKNNLPDILTGTYFWQTYQQ